MDEKKYAALLTRILIALLFFFTFHFSAAQDSYVTFKSNPGSFVLAEVGKSAVLFVGQNDFPGVIRAARDLQTDIKSVTDSEPSITDNPSSLQPEMVIVGTIGKNELIDQLIQNKKLDVSDVKGKWESFVIQVIDNPFPKVKHALVIAGSDKRGTIFGIYDLSRQIGVSPWYWWADVPVKKNKSIYVSPKRQVQGEPEVKYRGIFINDEEPALGRWVVENYGGFNHQFYEKVFELLLRHKANYIWPAMWWASFSSDDSLNSKIADDYGIVIGTTHHEPMMRAHAEWKTFGKGGEWNYETNETQLRKFWSEGIQRMNGYESIVSLGMRGDGDKAMTAETNVALLQRIVADQRKIIESVTGKTNSQVPQLWALYKEVQDYYDKGMTVPDDVTLLLCDDNWGNIRKLPRLEDRSRSGSFGIYYHFDYVGGPRNYKWMNTNPLPRVWEQMNLAYQYGANRIWIVNVGDIKPLEFPTSFFLDYAWNPKVWNADNLMNYSEQWAAQQFGTQFAKEIAVLLNQYSKFNGRRKPELLSADTYSLINYNEAERIVSEYNALTVSAEKIGKALPLEYQAAYYQLVLFPIKASANLHELWITVGKNRLYASQQRSSTNDLARRAKELFMKDSLLRLEYNKSLSGGKWNHMMDQTHISYTYWQQPDKDRMPEVKTIAVKENAEMRVAVGGSEDTWPSDKEMPRLEFDNGNPATHYIDIFNIGKGSIKYKISTTKTWLKVSKMQGTVEKEERLIVSVDWSHVPVGIHNSKIKLSDNSGLSIEIVATTRNTLRNEDRMEAFSEANGFISIEAEHFSRAVNATSVQWKVIPDLGKTGSAVTILPATAKSQSINTNTPHLEYRISMYDTGFVKVNAIFSPTLNFHNTEGLRYAISIDDEQPQVVNLHEDKSNKAWEKWVSDNCIVKITSHKLNRPGIHVLKFWMVDSGVLLQKIIVDAGGLKPSYLGPPESNYVRQVLKK